MISAPVWLCLICLLITANEIINGDNITASSESKLCNPLRKLAHAKYRDFFSAVKIKYFIRKKK